MLHSATNLSFHVTYRFVAEYTKSEELPHLDIKKDLEEAEQMYDALSELSILRDADNFDIAKFKRHVQGFRC